VVLKLKAAWRDGGTHQVMSPLEFMKRLAAPIQRFGQLRLRVPTTASRLSISGFGRPIWVEPTRRRAAACGHRVFNAGFAAMNPIGWPSQPDPLLSSAALTRAAVMQREEPVAARGCIHGIGHQADVRFGHQRSPERQL